MKTKKHNICAIIGAFMCLTAPLTTLATTKATTTPPPAQQIQTLLKQHLGVTIHDAKEAKAVMTKQLVSCYEKLRQCTPGHYKYAIPDPIAALAAMSSKTPSTFTPLILGTYDVQGFQGDKCIVNDSYQMQGAGYIKKCQFARDTLTVFTEQEASTTAQGNVALEAANPSKLQMVIQQNCQDYRDTIKTS